jgi:hypothetical protein
VGVSIEGAGGKRVRVGEIPDLASAIDLWLAQGDSIDVGLVDQDPPEGRPSNLDKSEYDILDFVRNRKESLSVSEPDKGPGTILSTRLSLQTRARAHALSSSYERSSLIVERLGAYADGSPKTPPYKGALQCFWSSSFSCIPVDGLGAPIFGDWDSDAGVSEICSLRLEYLFCVVLKGFFSEDMLADLLAWDTADPKGTGLVFRPLFGEMLGPPDLPRREGFKNALMSVVIKTHKSPIEDRNVVRLFNNNFSAASQLLRRMLVQLLEEEKGGWESRGLVFPVLRNTRHYLRQIGELNEIWSKPFSQSLSYPSGRRPPKVGEVLLDFKADVSKMYANFHLPFVIETIDSFLFERVLSHVPNTLEHKRAKRMRDIIMPLMIFLLEHIVIYIEWKEDKIFYIQRQGLPTGGSFSDAIAILCMWLCEKKLLQTWRTSNIGMQMYSRFVDDISIKMWVARDAVDATIQKVKLDLNSWHACIKVDPIVHIVTDPLGGNDPSMRSDFLDVSESYTIASGCVRIETSVFRKMPGYMHAPFSSALPSAVKLGTVISQRIRYITICSTEEAFNTVWDPYHAYFLNIGYSGGMLGKITQRYPYLSRAGLLAKMDTKAARRGFTSWDEDDNEERVVPLVLGARPGTRDYWREFKNLRLDSFEGLPQAALEHLPSKMLNSLTCTDSLADLFKKKGGLFAPSRS